MNVNTTTGESHVVIPGKAGESELEMRARLFACKKHHGQFRKYTHEPYIHHPAEVADIVRSVPHDQHMLAAAWLHDVIEDCGVKFPEIWNNFDSELAFMVDSLSDVSRPSDGNRDVRKAMDRAHTAKAHRVLGQETTGER